MEKQKMKAMFHASLLLFVAALLTPASAVKAADGEHYPIFLMCPHKHKFSAWSIFVIADKGDPKNISGIGLEKLNGKNSEDLAPNGYENCLAAQMDSKTQRETLGTLDAKDFGKGEIKVEKDDALHVGVTKVDDQTYRLQISMRCTSDKRFNVGGKDQKKRDILIKYDAGKKSWGACAQTLVDNEGQNAAAGGCAPITGITFPVIGTGIYRIVAVLGDGNPVLLVDGW
jgi:hypothetical protein